MNACAWVIFAISTHTLTWSVTCEFFYSISRVLKDFNSHAHVERDFGAGKTSLMVADFNSHAHVERDVLSTVFADAPPLFQLTRSRGA